MTIPVLKTIQDCGDYAKTVEPLVPQLYSLPTKLLETGGQIDSLKQLYVDTNPLVSSLAVTIVLGIIFIIVSEINRNYSQVDRLWSILPNLHAIHIASWARAAGLPHGRVDLVAVFTTLWSIQLTFNYWRKGGYNVGSEDYRWEILQKYVPRFVWTIFNATVISYGFNILLLLLSAPPAYAILLSSRFEPQITMADVCYFLIAVSFVAFESYCDAKMWAYQSTKYKYREDAKVPHGWKQEDLDRGFITSGPWQYSRHPNFISEQIIWFVLYQWSCYATNNLYSWTGIGSGCIFLVFQGSTLITEGVTAGKYPEYRDYQSQVGMFFPTSLTGYTPPSREAPAQEGTAKQPKVIRTSELLKRYEEKESKKQK